MTLHPALAISVGAIAGALSRYYLGLWLAQLWGDGFPYGTLAVNLLGSFVMGIVTTIIATQVIKLSPELTLLITVGFLGSFTTFSSYILDSAKLLEAGRTDKSALALSQLAIIYWLGSPVFGFLGLQGGIVLSRWLTQ